MFVVAGDCGFCHRVSASAAFRKGVLLYKQRGTCWGLTTQPWCPLELPHTPSPWGVRGVCPAAWALRGLQMTSPPPQGGTDTLSGHPRAVEHRPQKLRK